MKIFFRSAFWSSEIHRIPNWFGLVEKIKISTGIRIEDFWTTGTVALVPLGLRGLSEMYFSCFGLMLTLARFVQGG